MHLHRSLFSQGPVLAGIILGLVVTSAVPAFAEHLPALRLHVTAPLGTTSGDLDPVRISLENHSSLPLWFYPGAAPGYCFTLESGSRGPGDSIVSTSLFGRRTEGTILIPNRKTASAYGPSPWIEPNGSEAWPRFPLARLYDLTLPGLYHLRITTQSRLYTISGGAAIFRLTGYKRAGNILYWPPPLGVTVEQNHATKRIPRIASKSILVMVAAPYRKLPSVAVEPVVTPFPFPAQEKGISLRAGALANGGGMPVTLGVWLRAGPKPLRLRLTGNPLVDFRSTRVAGPDGFEGDHLVANPKPHYESIPDWKAVPLTAYGKWLAKHRSSKGLKWKTYVLEPGVVYKYTVPVNLSCRFDMSLAGAYHVRLRLARTHIWSPWVTVTVPPS
ncbi:MAG: hypothetical protein ACP5I8_17050 [Phycisphaerae bacterium]